MRPSPASTTSPPRLVLRFALYIGLTLAVAAVGFLWFVHRYEDYGRVAAATRDAFLPIASGLAIGLLGLFAALVPILRRVTRRLQEHVEQIEYVQVLKIDKAFVLNMERDEDDAIIVRSTINLGHNLGLEVVAEGIETRRAWDRLAGFGCDVGQGYFLGRPAPADALALEPPEEAPQAVAS